MAVTVKDNSVQQINTALLSLKKEIDNVNTSKEKDKEEAKKDPVSSQYRFMSPLKQTGNTVTVDTTGVWQGTARSATTAESAASAVNATHADTSDTAVTATNADITKTPDTNNGDKLQIGNGTSVNITNAAHANVADNGVPSYSATEATKILAVNSSGTATEWVDKPSYTRLRTRTSPTINNNSASEGYLVYGPGASKATTDYVLVGDGTWVDKIEVVTLYTGNFSTQNSNLTLTESIDNFRYLIVIGTSYAAEQAVSVTIPKDAYYYKGTSSYANEFIINGSISGTTRRLYFGFLASAPTKLYTGGIAGSSGYLPRILRVYGVR